MTLNIKIADALKTRKEATGMSWQVIIQSGIKVCEDLQRESFGKIIKPESATTKSCPMPI